MIMVETKFSFKLLIVLIRELNHGKSLARTLLNFNLKEIELAGAVLDLGSKSSKASYNRFFKLADNCRLTYTDWHEEGKDIVKLNLEERFLIEDNKYDFITCFNVLEHVFNFNNLVAESYRVLKPDGLYIGQTPFLVNYHADPSDYFRYTNEAIEKIFKAAGFICEKMVYLGFGPCVAAISLKSYLYPKWLRPCFALLAIAADSLILKIKKSQRWRYPLGYLYIMRKK